ncbi:hypothetical protein ABPG74_016965 [Tetrahymena malaccensis]
MRIVQLASILFIFQAVFVAGEECQKINDKQDCLSNTSCYYNVTSFQCSSKCSSINNSNDCEQKSACKFQAPGCSSKVTNCELITNPLVTAEQCQSQNPACIYNPAVPKCRNNINTVKNCINNNNNFKMCSSFDYCEFNLQGNIQCSFMNFNCDPNQCNNQFCDYNQQCQSINVCKQYTQDKCTGSCQWNNDLNYCIDTCASVELSKCIGTPNCQLFSSCNLNNNKANAVCNAITTSNQDCMANPACIPTTKGFCQPKSGICTLQNCPETICEKYTTAKCTNPTCKIQDPNQCESFCQAFSGKCIPKDDSICTNKQNTQELCETQNSYCQYSQQGVCSAKDIGQTSSQQHFQSFSIFIALIIFSLIQLF